MQAGHVKDKGSVPELSGSSEEEKATHSSILAWRIPMDSGAWWATVHRVTKRVGHDWVTKHSTAEGGVVCPIPPQISLTVEWHAFRRRSVGFSVSLVLSIGRLLQDMFGGFMIPLLSQIFICLFTNYLLSTSHCTRYHSEHWEQWDPRHQCPCLPGDWL